MDATTKTCIIFFVLSYAYTVLVLGNVTGPIPYQSTCNPNVTSIACSNSSYCQCAQALTGEAICTQQMSCDYATPCEPDGSCLKENSTCVIDSRCPNQRLCYSVVLFSPELCPHVVAE